MRLTDFWATLLRRWYLGLAVLALTVGGTLYVVDKVGPTYEADGSVLVFPPVATVQRETELQAQGNPYLVLNGVSQARDIVIRTLTSKSTLDEVANEFPGSTFEATPDFTNSAPIILITAEAGSSADATAVLATVMDRVPKILVDLQSGLDLPSQAEITSRPLVADAEPDPVYSGQIRAGLVAGVVALGLGLLLIGLLDGLLAGRAAKKRSERTGDEKNHRSAGSSAAQEPDARGEGGPRRLGPRAPVRPKGDRAVMIDDRKDITDQATAQRPQTVSIRLGDTNGAARAAKA